MNPVYPGFTFLLQNIQITGQKFQKFKLDKIRPFYIFSSFFAKNFICSSNLSSRSNATYNNLTCLPPFIVKPLILTLDSSKLNRLALKVESLLLSSLSTKEFHITIHKLLQFLILSHQLVHLFFKYGKH